MNKFLRYFLVLTVVANFLIVNQIKATDAAEMTKKRKEENQKALKVTMAIVIPAIVIMGISSGYDAWENYIKKSNIPESEKEEFIPKSRWEKPQFSKAPKLEGSDFEDLAKLEKAYKTLGLKDSATQRDFNQAYRKLQMKWHPDKNPGKEALAEEKIKEINSARDTIKEYQESAVYRKIQNDPVFEKLNKAQTSAEFKDAIENVASEFGIKASDVLRTLKDGKQFEKFKNDWNEISSSLQDKPIDPNKLAEKLKDFGLEKTAKRVAELKPGLEVAPAEIKGIEIKSWEPIPQNISQENLAMLEQEGRLYEGPEGLQYAIGEGFEPIIEPNPVEPIESITPVEPVL